MGRRDPTYQALGNGLLAVVIPAVEDHLNLYGVPGHDEIGEK